MGFAYGRLISNEIGDTNSSSRFCNFCSEHGGGYCYIAAEAPFEERKRLMAIRNSLKEVENMVMFLEVKLLLYIILSSFSLLLLLWIAQIGSASSLAHSLIAQILRIL